MNGLLLQKLIDVIKELETLKPVVQRQVAEHNRGGTVESNTNSLNRNYGTTRRIAAYSKLLYSTGMHCITLHFLACNIVKHVGKKRWRIYTFRFSSALLML